MPTKSDLTLDLSVIHECLYPASSTNHLSNSDNTISFKEDFVKEGSGQSGSSPFVCVGHRQVGRHGTRVETGGGRLDMEKIHQALKLPTITGEDCLEESKTSDQAPRYDTDSVRPLGF